MYCCEDGKDGELMTGFAVKRQIVSRMEDLIRTHNINFILDYISLMQTKT